MKLQFLIPLLIISLTAPLVYAEHSPKIEILVETDKQMYKEGDSVKVTGQISTYSSDNGQLKIQLFNGDVEFLYPDNNHYIFVPTNGTFRVAFGFDEFLINEENYTLRASYVSTGAQNDVRELHPEIPSSIDNYSTKLAYVDGNFAETTFSYIQRENWVTTDKDIYYPGDEIVVKGHSTKSSPHLQSLNGELLKLMTYSMPYFTYNFVAGDHYNYHGNFPYDGINGIKLAHGMNVVAETTFIVDCSNNLEQCRSMEPPPNPTMTITTDKITYYLSNNIFVSGTVSNIDWSEDTTVTYMVSSDRYMTIQSSTTVDLQEDGNFNFTIDTIEWDGNSDYYDITINIQNLTEKIRITYDNTPSIQQEPSIINIITNINLFTTETIEDGEIFYLVWSPIVDYTNIDVTMIPQTGNPVDFTDLDLNSRNSIIAPSSNMGNDSFDVQLLIPDIQYTSESTTLHTQGNFITISPLHNSYDLQDTISFTGNNTLHLPTFHPIFQQILKFTCLT